MNFWDIVGIFFWSYVFVAYLIALYTVLGDIFRDRNLHGVYKAIWIIFLVFLPFLTVLVYVIARGRGMAERAGQRADANRSQAEADIRSVTTASPSKDIADAKTLLDAGTISQSDFDALKQHAISTLGTGPMSG